MTLCRLIYISRPAFPVRPGWLQGPLADILSAGLRNNPENGLTGLLGIERNRFFQILEGEQDCLDLTFKRICADRRHFDIRKISFEEASRRVFHDWAIAFAMGARLPPRVPLEPDFETMSAQEILARGVLLRETGVVAERESTGFIRAG